MDDIASEILALRQIVFFVWVTLNEHKWVISRERRGPVVIFGDSGLLVVRRAGPLIIHFEEEKIGELLDVVAVGTPSSRRRLQ